MHPCIVIPVFNHGHGIGRVLESLRTPTPSRNASPCTAASATAARARR